MVLNFLQITGGSYYLFNNLLHLNLICWFYFLFQICRCERFAASNLCNTGEKQNCF